MKHIRRILYYILLSYLSVSVVLLSFRIILRLLDANTNSPFYLFIIATTEIMLLPFVNLFNLQKISEDSVFDTNAFIAMISYLILIPLSMLVIRFVTGSVSEASKVDPDSPTISS